MTINLTSEQWKYVRDNHHYKVSNVGRVKNAKTGRILKMWLNTTGHVYTSPYRNGVQETKIVARLVAEVFVPGGKSHLIVDHLDGDLTNNKADNLAWITRADRLTRSYDDPKGKRERKAIQIVETSQKFDSVKELATYLNTDVSKIYCVMSGERKTHRGYHFQYL